MAAVLACIAALVASPLLLSLPCSAKSSVTPIYAPGDPDEFESRTGCSGGAGGRIAMEGEPSTLDPGTYPGGDHPCPEVRTDGLEEDWYESIRRALRRVLNFIAIELDVV